MSRAKRVACITTTYYPDSHADVIASRLLGEFGYDPDVQVASLYTDQVPENDVSREKAGAAGVPIYPTIHGAIAADGNPVDGVVVIGEHGEYPWLERRQKMYPRRRFHGAVVEALDRLDLAVPVFNDKHFAYEFDDATWIYRAYEERDVPFFGGSSVPLVEKRPAVDRATLRDAEEIFVGTYGRVESYGFHAMEVLQSLAERRAGGETGVASIEPFEGRAVWDAADRGAWPEALMEAALEHSREDLPGHPRDHVDVPTLFTIEYRDGLRAHVLNLRGYLGDWVFAVRGEETAGGYCDTEKGRPYRHFDALVGNIEELVLEGAAPIPPERTYLTTGLIDLGMEALFEGEKRTTPELGFGYDVPATDG